MDKTVKYSMELIGKVIENQDRNMVATNNPAPDSVSNMASEPVPDLVLSTHSKPTPDTVPSATSIPDQVPLHALNTTYELIPEEVSQASASNSNSTAIFSQHQQIFTR